VLLPIPQPIVAPLLDSWRTIVRLLFAIESMGCKIGRCHTHDLELSVDDLVRRL
jgi:hypothetical protein